MKDIRFRQRLRRESELSLPGRIVKLLDVADCLVVGFVFRASAIAVLMVSVNSCWSSFLVAVVLVRFGSHCSGIVVVVDINLNIIWWYQQHGGFLRTR